MLEAVKNSPVGLGSYRAKSLESSVLNQEYYHSSLTSIKKTAMLGKVVSWPFAKLGQFFSWIGTLLKNYLFCCCDYSRKDDPIDWRDTKDLFEKIYAAVITSRDHGVDKQKAFTDAYRGLSEAAKERFRQHIGFAIAARDHGITERAKQEEWYGNNRGKIDFRDDYFGKIPNNNILKEAVKAFYSEIQSRC